MSQPSPAVPVVPVDPQLPALLRRFETLVQEGGFDAWHERTVLRQIEGAADLPEPFADLVAALCAEGADTPAAGAAGGGAGGEEFGLVGLGVVDEHADSVLAVIEQLEAARARLDGRIVDAYGALRAAVADQVEHRAVLTGSTDTARRSHTNSSDTARRSGDGAHRGRHGGDSGGGVDMVTVDEVVTATAVPVGEAYRRLRLAGDPVRYEPLRARLAAGGVSLFHAGLIAAEVAQLAGNERWDEAVHDQVLAQVSERVLAPLPGGARPTHAQVRARLTRILKALADPGGAGRRRQAAVAARRLVAQLGEDGMGVLSLHAPAEQVVAVADRVERLARALRQGGDPRSLDQLRVDLAVQALLRHGYGPCPQHAPTPASSPASDDPDPASDRTTETSSGPSGHPDEAAEGDDPTADALARGAAAARDSASGSAGDDPAPVSGRASGSASGAASESESDPASGLAGGAVAWPCGCAPTAPAATAWIVVPFEVATGLCDAPCELPGHGWVTAEHARAIITAPGSVWRWLAVDHPTGRALELGTTRYRPTPAMIEQVRALDGHCRGPGCTIEARRCDIDHHTPWPTGPTTVGNLGPLDHRHHHQPKTDGLTSCVRIGDPQQRALHWTTVTGREYLTYPKSWTEALHDPKPPGP